MLKRLVHMGGKWYNSKILHSEFLHQRPDPRGINERPLEYSFALEALIESPFQDVLDVGTGEGPWPALLSTCGYHVTAIDKIEGYWINGFLNRHFWVQRHDVTQGPMSQKFGSITCLSVIEHIPDSTAAVKSMAGMLKPDGLLILSFPFHYTRYVPNAYALPDAGYGKNNSYICQIYNPAKISEWLSASRLECVHSRYFRCFNGEFWTQGGRLTPMIESSAKNAHLACLVLV